MTRDQDTVTLPEPPEPAGGCAQHGPGRCAYTGTEAGRCPRCHGLWFRIWACGCHVCGPRGDTAHHAETCGIPKPRPVKDAAP